MGKKLGALVLVLALCAGAWAPLALAGAATTFVTLPSNMSALNVRASASTSAEVVAWVIDGDEIDVVKVGTDWSKITVARSGKTGYIRNRYILDLPEAPKGPAQPSKVGTARAGRVGSNGVNLRRGPGTGYASLGKLKSGARLKIWSSSGNWHFVTTAAGKDGWISKTYVKGTYEATTTARVNFRKTINGALIRTLPVGTKVTVQEISGNWHKVKVGKTTGYVYKYLR